MTARSVLVLEPELDGHHAPYLAWICRSLSEAGYAVKAVTRELNAADPAVNDVIRSGAVQVTTRKTKSQRLEVHLRARSIARQQFAYWQLLRQWFIEETAGANVPTVVFLPYVDYCLYAIGLLGSPFGRAAWAAVAMRPSFHYQAHGVLAPKAPAGRIKKTLFQRVLNEPSLIQLFTVDETLAGYYSHPSPRLRRRPIYLPQPALTTDLPDRGQARAVLGIPPDKRILLAYGHLSARKGIDTLVRALASRDFPDDVTVILAGATDPALAQSLAEPPATNLADAGRLCHLNGYLTPDKQTLLIAAADVIWLGYVGHFTPSGVLTEAAAAARPVIACQEGIIGWLTARHGLGAILRSHDPSEVSLAVRASLEMTITSGSAVQLVSTPAQSAAVILNGLSSTQIQVAL